MSASSEPEYEMLRDLEDVRDAAPIDITVDSLFPPPPPPVPHPWEEGSSVPEGSNVQTIILQLEPTPGFDAPIILVPASGCWLGNVSDDGIVTIVSPLSLCVNRGRLVCRES